MGDSHFRRGILTAIVEAMLSGWLGDKKINEMVMEVVEATDEG